MFPTHFLSVNHTVLRQWFRESLNNFKKIQQQPVNFYRCTVHSDIHTDHSPTDAHLLKF